MSGSRIVQVFRERVRRLPPLARVLLALWTLLAFFVAYIPEMQRNVPPLALAIFCAPAILAFLILAGFVILRWMRRLLAPVLWIARKVHGDG